MPRNFSLRRTGDGFMLPGMLAIAGGILIAWFVINLVVSAGRRELQREAAEQRLAVLREEERRRNLLP